MRVAIVGSGYVGLTTGVCLAAVGHQVICVDVNPDRVAAINAGKAPFHEPGLPQMLLTALSSGLLSATTGYFGAIAESDVIFITVPTPQKGQGIDLSYLAEAARHIGAALQTAANYKVVVVKSTVVPGTTDTLVRTILEDVSWRRAGEWGLCMVPEFLQEGSAVDDSMNPDRIVIGRWDERSGQVLAEMYRPFECPKIFTTLRNAEMLKCASNSLLATLISFSNQIAALCEATPDTDIEVVMDALHLDRRLSPVVDGQRIRPGILSFLRAGCGFGGSCLPKDVNALRSYARVRDVPSRLLDAVMSINAERSAHLVSLCEMALGSLEGATVAVLGLAFKAGTDDMRESPAIGVISYLAGKGALVRAYDPMVCRPTGLEDKDNVVLCRMPDEALTGADAAVVVTAWPEFAQWDWDGLCAKMRRQVIVDGRNSLRSVSWPACVEYLSIGTPATGKNEE